MTKGDLFSDLVGEPLDAIEKKYDELLETIERLEEERKQMHISKKIHSEVIQFAVNKLAKKPDLDGANHDSLLAETLEQKAEFDRLLSDRDALVSRFSISKPRVLKLMTEFHRQLTHHAHHGDAPSLAHEIQMFSKYFELQAMLQGYEHHNARLSELNVIRAQLLENVKAVNRNDRKLSQSLNKNSEIGRSERREAGRLAAYLKTQKRPTAQPVPPPAEDLSERLASGGSFSLDELASMLAHGGLAEFSSEPQQPTSTRKSKQKKNQRRAGVRRGSTTRMKNTRE